MLKRISLRNFQKHSSIDLNLDEGINVIVGSTDTGKSSIFRGIGWPIRNRPTGFFFRHDPRIAKTGKKPLSDSAITSVSLLTSEGIEVIRERDKKDLNQYRISSLKDPLKALRSDVPEEISEILRIPRCAIQSQHDAYFLLNDSAGEVARQINELIGLEIIDYSLKKVNAIIDDAKNKRDEVAKDIDLITDELNSLKFLPFAEKLAENISISLEIIDELTDSINDLNEMLISIQEYEEKIGNLPDYSIIEKRISSLEQQIIIFQQLEKDIDLIAEYIEDIEEIDAQLISIGFKMQWLDSIDNLLDLINTHDNLIEPINELYNLIDDLEHYDDSIMELKQRIEQKTQKYIDALKTAGKCPVCGNNIKEKMVADIL
jgi:DNA repair exonuclease SbcCD ATPase subunit